MDSVEAEQQKALQQWLQNQLPEHAGLPVLRPLPGDAGQRRYWEIVDQPDYLVASSPPESEPNRSFIACTLLLARNGLPVPKLFAIDLSRGFFLLEHLGRQPLRSLYPTDGADALQPALSLLSSLAAIPGAELAELPEYDRAKLVAEMELFEQWFVAELLSIELNKVERSELAALYQQLATSAIEQPQGFVHRDYHCRNIMLSDTPAAELQLGIIDYQDAVVGPLSYDLVSLLKDCYWQWPSATREALVAEFYRHNIAPLEGSPSLAEFSRQFDWMGLQRHIKVLGIFARLALRDNKPGYLQDLPLVIHYTLEVAACYPQLQPFAEWFKARLMPTIAKQSWFGELGAAGQ